MYQGLKSARTGARIDTGDGGGSDCTKISGEDKQEGELPTLCLRISYESNDAGGNKILGQIILI